LKINLGLHRDEKLLLLWFGFGNWQQLIVLFYFNIDFENA